MVQDLEKFKALLEDQHDFPTHYVFKFIVPTDKITQLTTIVGEAEIATRPSKKGNYHSITVKVEVTCSDDIITIYQRVSVIEGIISL